MPRGSKRPSPPRTFTTALALAQHLESRWFRLSVEDGWLMVRPARWVTDEDRVHIRQHRDALLQLVQDTPANGTGLRFTRFDPSQACASPTVH